MDVYSARVFEQEIRMGKGVDKHVKVQLGAAQLNAKGKQLQARRLSLEQEELNKPGKEGTLKRLQYQPLTLPQPILPFRRSL
ncbi:MAG: hypothetical protein IPP36_11455 [Nitrosomonadales bacterium]|nr:hypothetical protein [Nitrosomonadales bacterium]